MYKLARQDFAYLFGAGDQYDAGTNEFTGSAPSKDGTTGIYSNEFRYRVKMNVQDKKPVEIIAEYYYGYFCFSATDQKKIISKVFEPNEHGVNAAFDWLEEEYNK